MKYIISLAAALLIIGCSSEQQSSQESTQTAPEGGIIEKIQTKTAEVTQNVSQSVEESAKKVKEISEEVVTEATATAKETTEHVTQAIEETSQSVKEGVAETTKSISNSVEQVAQDLDNALVPQQEEIVDAKSTFTRKCAGCHGATGEKAALGKSQIIKGWEESKVVAALQGYKDGSYGGAMKGLMASQVSSLSQEDIKALAAFISKQ